MKSLQFRPSFEADLIDIWTFIALDNPVAADAFVDTIRVRCNQLANFPKSGVASDDIVPGTRRLTFGTYLILYVETDATVDLVRCLHGKRDLRDDT